MAPRHYSHTRARRVTRARPRLAQHLRNSSSWESLRTKAIFSLYWEMPHSDASLRQRSWGEDLWERGGVTAFYLHAFQAFSRPPGASPAGAGSDWGMSRVGPQRQHLRSLASASGLLSLRTVPDGPAGVSALRRRHTCTVASLIFSTNSMAGHRPLWGAGPGSPGAGCRKGQTWGKGADPPTGTKGLNSLTRVTRKRPFYCISSK